MDFSDPWPSGQPQAEIARYGRRSPELELPENIVSMMKTFGQFECNPMGAEIDAGSVWRNLGGTYTQ